MVYMVTRCLTVQYVDDHCFVLVIVIVMRDSYGTMSLLMIICVLLPSIKLTIGP